MIIDDDVTFVERPENQYTYPIIVWWTKIVDSIPLGVYSQRHVHRIHRIIDTIANNVLSIVRLILKSSM